ncbi:hypothetical protein CsSME_00052709 [Camellia sinensis var. sinensis]
MVEMEEQRDVEGATQRIVGDGESGGDPMAGRRHCGDNEGGADYTPECESQPHFRMGNNSIQSGGTVYTPQGESQPHFVMGGNSIQSGGTVYTSQGESQPHFVMGGNSIQSGDAIYTCQGQSQSRFVMGGNSTQDHGLRVNFSQSQPRFVMGINYNKDHRHDMYISPSQPRPQVLMGGTSGPPLTYGTYDGNNTAQSMPSVYPTHRSFQGLLRGTSVENFAVHLSQASHTPADSHVD